MLMRTRTLDTDERKRRRSRPAVFAVLAIAAGLGGTTAAEPTPTIDLTGTGTYQLANDGTVTVHGTATGRPVTGPYTGTLTANDGSLPAPGDCEPATATLRVDGAKRRFIELTAHGDVCGQWTDTIYRVTHVFTGRFDLTASFPQRNHGIDGFYEVRIADNGVSSLFAIDT